MKRIRKSLGKRNLRFESLERREVLNGDLVSTVIGNWHNESNARDVDGDGVVRARDIVVVINLISRFGVDSITQTQAAWYEADSDAPELAGGYHPDVNGDGSVSPLDALQIINDLGGKTAGGDSGSVAVMPDEQGRPMSISYTDADGHSQAIDLSQLDVTVDWTDGNVTVIGSDDVVRVMARPGVGLLEADYSGDDGNATVWRFNEDGNTVVERYVCVPVMSWPEPIVIPQIDPRKPIEGFEEMLGAIVSRETTDAEGFQIVEQYQEASDEFLLSIRGTQATGESLTVDVERPVLGSTIFVPAEPGSVVTMTLASIASDLKFLLENGFRQETPMTTQELADVVSSL